jgi:hypothetical protein
MYFHRQQTVDDLIDHGRRLITLLAREHPLRFFIRNARSPNWIQIVKGQTETSLFELEALQFAMIVLIVFDDPPPDIFQATVEVLKEGNGLDTSLDQWVIPVQFHNTVEWLFEQAWHKVPQPVQLYAIDGTTGRMTELHKSTNKLYYIVLDHPRLRVQQAPDMNAQTFILVDSDQKYMGTSFKWPLVAHESTEELAKKIQKYLNVPEKLGIVFRLEDGRFFVPTTPFREIPREPFDVLVCPIE